LVTSKPTEIKHNPLAFLLHLLPQQKSKGSFHATRGLPTKKRSVRRDDGLWSLYCFAQRVDAAAFRHLFGGQLFKRMPPQ
jgi:hypothetical protein